MKPSDFAASIIFLSTGTHDAGPADPVQRKGRNAGLGAILLDARGAQAGEAVLVEGALPAQIFLGGQRVALTGFLEAQQAPAHSCHHFRLAADNPAVIARRGQVRNCERTAIGTDDIVDAGTQLTVHTQTHSQTLGPETHGYIRPLSCRLCFPA